jgi:hypothetical protein
MVKMLALALWTIILALTFFPLRYLWRKLRDSQLSRSSSGSSGTHLLK